MVVAPTYKARLIFAARAPGVLNWDNPTQSWDLPTGHRAVLTARHVSSLAEATEFHFDVGGFETPEEAFEIGENLRAALRLANAVLGLGLNVPVVGQETPRARLAPHIKEKIASDYGTAIVDCVFGLNVLKEGEEFELAVKGDLSAKPRDSAYVLEAASQLWRLDARLDDLSRLACELLNSASRDPSPKSAFMVVFLALDLLMERRKRPDDAQQVLAGLQKVVDESGMDSAEKQRLRSFLGGWRRTSLEAEFARFAALGANGQIVVHGEPLADFLKKCLRLRHRLAHPPGASDVPAISENELNERKNGLRQVVLSVVWARNKLPPVSVNRPGDIVQVSEMKVSIL